MSFAPDYTKLNSGIDITSIEFNPELLKTLSQTVINAADITVTGNVQVDETTTLNQTLAQNISATQGVFNTLYIPTPEPDDTTSTKVVNIQFVNRAVDNAIASLIDGAPQVLDTFREISEAINNDGSYFETVNTKFADLKQNVDSSFNSIQSEIASLEQQTATNFSNLSNDLSSNVATLNNSIQQSNQTLTSLVTSTDSQLRSLIAAEDARVELAANLRDISLSNLISATEQQLTNSINTLDNQIQTQLNSTNQTIDNNFNSLTNSINSLSASTDLSFGLTNQAIQATNQTIGDVSNNLQQFKVQTSNNFNTAQSNLNSVASNLTSQIDLRAYKTYVDTRDDELQASLANTNSVLSAQIIVLDNNIQSVQTSKADLSYVNEQFNNILNMAPEQLNSFIEVANQLNANENDIMGLINTVASVRTDLSSTETSLISKLALQEVNLTNQINSNASKTDISLNSLNLYSQSLNEKIDLVNSTLSAKDSQFQTDLSNVQISIQNELDLREASQAANLALRDISINYLNASKADLSELNSAIQSVNSVVDTKEDKSTVSNYVSSLTNTISTKADISNVDVLASQVSSGFQSVNSALLLKEDKSTVATYVSSLTNQINSINATKASTTYVDEAIAGLINAAPETLNTLGELANQLQQDQNSITTILTSLGQKANASDVSSNVQNLQSQINTKAGTIYVDDLITALDLAKANKSYVDTVDLTLSNRIDLKADITSLNTLSSNLNSQLATKLDTSAFDVANSQLETSLQSNLALRDTSINNLTQISLELSDAVDTLNLELNNKIDASDVALLFDDVTNNLQSINTTLQTKANYSDLSLAINNLLNGASASYDTLKELEVGLNNNESVTSTILSTLATKASQSSVTDLSNNLTLSLAYVADLSNNLSLRIDAVNTQLSDVSNAYASKTYVDNAIASIPPPNPQIDLSGYVQFTDLSGYATKSYVDSAIASIPSSGGSGSSSSTVDLSGYALVSYVDSKDALIQSQLDTLTTSKATYTYVDNKVSELVNSAPSTLDTLSELASALGNNANFSTTVINQIATKANDNAVVHLTGAESIGGLKTFADGISTTSINGIGSTTLEYLSGVTSNIQTQLDSKMSSSGGGFVDLTTNDQIITGNKTWNNLNSFQRIVERMQTLTVASNQITLDYSTGNIAYVVPPSATNLTLNLNNVPLSSYSGSTFTITIIINAQTNKAYVNNLFVNGGGAIMRYAGGVANVSLTSAIFAVQTITILVVPGTTTVGGVLTSVTQWF